MKKRLFQILDEMNVLDNGRKANEAFVIVLPPSNVIAVNKKGNHGEITFGCPPNIPIEVMQNKDLRMICLIVDGKKYDELKTISSNSRELESNQGTKSVCSHF